MCLSKWKFHLGDMIIYFAFLALALLYLRDNINNLNVNIGFRLEMKKGITKLRLQNNDSFVSIHLLSLGYGQSTYLTKQKITFSFTDMIFDQQQLLNTLRILYKLLTK